jgi:hypothetical protein
MLLLLLREKRNSLGILLSCRFKSTSACYKGNGKHKHKKIKHILNKETPNKQQNINVNAVDK